MIEVVTPLTYFILKKCNYKHDKNSICVIRKITPITPRKWGKQLVKYRANSANAILLYLPPEWADFNLNTSF